MTYRLIREDEADTLAPADITAYRVTSIKEHETPDEEILYGIFFTYDEALELAEEVQSNGSPCSIVEQVFTYAYMGDIRDFEAECICPEYSNDDNVEPVCEQHR